MGNRSDVQCRYHFLQMQRDGKMPIKTTASPPPEPKREVPRAEPLGIEDDASLFDWI
jgi:hypothetical protein